MVVSNFSTSSSCKGLFILSSPSSSFSLLSSTSLSRILFSISASSTPDSDMRSTSKEKLSSIACVALESSTLIKPTLTSKSVEIKRIN